MKFWLVNHSWDSFRRSQEFCGFKTPEEQQKIAIGDRIVYFGQNLVFGVFEAVALVENEFNGWGKAYSFQVKLGAIAISKGGLLAKSLQDRLMIQKASGGSPNLLELTEKEFGQIKDAINTGQKLLIFV